MIEANRKNIVNAITRMLARREHGFDELIAKLGQRGFDAELVVTVLDEFRQADIQSDLRFADAKVRHGAYKGQGPVRIKQECLQLGLAENIVEQAFRDNDIDWFELAKEVKVKKYKNDKPIDLKNKYKQMRFLQYRGFSHEQIHYALTDDA
jgi:regulatory protein